MALWQDSFVKDIHLIFSTLCLILILPHSISLLITPFFIQHFDSSICRAWIFANYFCANALSTFFCLCYVIRMMYKKWKEKIFFPQFSKWVKPPRLFVALQSVSMWITMCVGVESNKRKGKKKKIKGHHFYLPSIPSSVHQTLKTTRGICVFMYIFAWCWIYMY